MKVEYSARADTLYVGLSEEEVAYTKRLDDLRMVDYSASGRVVGVEFIGASKGVDLSGLNGFAHGLEKAIREAHLGFKVYV